MTKIVRGSCNKTEMYGESSNTSTIKTGNYIRILTPVRHTHKKPNAQEKFCLCFSLQFHNEPEHFPIKKQKCVGITMIARMPHQEKVFERYVECSKCVVNVWGKKTSCVVDCRLH